MNKNKSGIMYLRRRQHSIKYTHMSDIPILYSHTIILVSLLAILGKSTFTMIKSNKRSHIYQTESSGHLNTAPSEIRFYYKSAIYDHIFYTCFHYLTLSLKLT